MEEESSRFAELLDLFRATSSLRIRLDYRECYRVERFLYLEVALERLIEFMLNKAVLMDEISSLETGESINTICFYEPNLFIESMITKIHKHDV